MKANAQSTTIKNIKKSLKNATGFVIIIYKIITELVVEGLKKFWNNWQWALALVAVLYSIFLFYYQSSTTTPTRITECEKRLAEHIQKSELFLAEHIQKSDKHFEKIDQSISDLNVINAGIDAKLEAIREDTNTTKTLLFELLGKRL